MGNRKFNCILLITTSLLVFRVCITSAQSGKSDKKFSAFPFPVIYYAPETHFVFGAAGSATFRFKKDDVTARPSNIVVGAAYTQNKQVLLYTNFQTFYDNNNYYIYGEAGYYIYSYYYYGLGTNAVPKELYNVDYPRIKLNATKRVLPHIYAGPGYQYENYKITQTQPGGQLSQWVIPGSKGSTTSGLGAQILYDSRDTIFYPYKGYFGTLSYMNNGHLWGGNYEFNRLILEITKYQKLYKNIVLVINTYNSFVMGTAPFQQLSQLGSNKEMRGYYQGQYTDHNLMILEAEGRFPIYGRFGGVVFANSGALGNQQDFIRFNEIKYTFGAGLRFNIVRKDHLNLRLDYALGPHTDGIYFTIGEAF